MVGDWIKMRVDLWDHPKVVRLASSLDADKLRVLGALFRTWSLADQYTTDGRLAGYRPEDLDAAVGVQGWSEALSSIEWLEIESQAVVVPRFEKHNGQSAKRRALDRDRKRSSRSVRKASAPKADTKPTRSGPELEIEREVQEIDDHSSTGNEEGKNHVLAWCGRKFRGGSKPLVPQTEAMEPADRELLLKLGVLVLDGDLPESHVDHALEAIRHHNTDPADGGRPIENRLAYLTSCLHDRLGGPDPEEGKKRLNAMLARVELPAELLKPRPQPEEAAA